MSTSDKILISVLGKALKLRREVAEIAAILNQFYSLTLFDHIIGKY